MAIIWKKIEASKLHVKAWKLTVFQRAKHCSYIQELSRHTSLKDLHANLQPCSYLPAASGAGWRVGDPGAWILTEEYGKLTRLTGVNILHMGWIRWGHCY